MTMKIKILTVLSVLLNLFILFFGFVSWMDAYNPERALVSVALIVAGLVNFILIAHEFRSTERRLEKRVRIARLEKELADLGR